MPKFIQWTRAVVYRLIQRTGAQFIYQIADNIKFDRLGRRPPELIWRALPRSTRERYDAGCVQLADKLYMIAGFCGQWPYTVNKVSVFDLAKNRWAEEFAIPDTMAQSHLAITHADNRYIYVLGGQLGPFCSPATANCFVFDTQTEQWSSLPPLPEPRFSLAAQYWHGRIHVCGGSKPDRVTPALDHWSLGVAEGKATEATWRNEAASVPRGGPHRGSLIIQDQFYVFGGQKGDVIARPGDPEYRPVFELTEDIIYPDVYALRYGADRWERKADMPVAVSHTESSVLQIGDWVLVIGGQTSRLNNPTRCFITDLIQGYDPASDSWKIMGHTPYPIKTPMVGYWNNWLYSGSGQQGDPAIGPTIAGPYDLRMWRAKFKARLSAS